MARCALILAGGMGKGAYEVGALNAISEYFAPSQLCCVSAASIGSLNAYAFMTGQLKKLNDIWKGLNFSGHRSLITSVLKSDYLVQIIESIVTDTPVAAPLHVPLLNLREREMRYYDFRQLDWREMANYMRASVTIPFYSKGIMIDGHRLYDGAVVDNIPVKPVINSSTRPDYVICVYFDDFNYVFESCEIDGSIIKLTFPDKTILSNAVNIKHDSVMRMMEAGYIRTKEALQKFFLHGVDDVEYIRSAIAEQNADAARIMRITGDVALSNLNRITRKLVKRELTMNADI